MSNMRERERERERERNTKQYLSKAAGLMGITPDDETRASTSTSFGVTGISSSSIICTE